jgi:hypothetical protein
VEGVEGTRITRLRMWVSDSGVKQGGGEDI